MELREARDIVEKTIEKFNLDLIERKHHPAKNREVEYYEYVLLVQFKNIANTKIKTVQLMILMNEFKLDISTSPITVEEDENGNHVIRAMHVKDECINYCMYMGNELNTLTSITGPSRFIVDTQEKLFMSLYSIPLDGISPILLVTAIYFSISNFITFNSFIYEAITDPNKQIGTITEDIDRIMVKDMARKSMQRDEDDDMADKEIIKMLTGVDVSDDDLIKIEEAIEKEEITKSQISEILDAVKDEFNKRVFGL